MLAEATVAPNLLVRLWAHRTVYETMVSINRARAFKQLLLLQVAGIVPHSFVVAPSYIHLVILFLWIRLLQFPPLLLPLLSTIPLVRLVLTITSWLSSAEPFTTARVWDAPLGGSDRVPAPPSACLAWSKAQRHQTQNLPLPLPHV